MSNLRKKSAILIGRFQPLHNGHFELAMKWKMENAEHLTIVLGSSAAPVSEKNPWTADYRETIWRAALAQNDEDLKNYSFIKQPNSNPYDPYWFASEIKKKMLQTINGAEHNDFVLLGHKRDESSFYLDLFPEYDQALFAPFKDDLSGQHVRSLIWKERWDEVQRLIPYPVFYLQREDL